MVEDTADVLAIGKAMLEKLGYIVIAAHSPENALQIAESCNDKIDLVITDVIMPDMNGRDLAEKLRSLHPETKFLFMSGYTADIISDQGVLDKGVHFMQKPFTFDSMSSKVKTALND